MSNVIVILKEPRSCMFCELGHSTICEAIYNEKTNDRPREEYAKYNIYGYKLNRTKPDWCPLKAIPNKVDSFNCEELCDVKDWYNSGYADGWNTCIDKILSVD